MLRLGRSGEYRIQPDFPAWGVLPWFDVAKLRTLREATSGARRNIRNWKRRLLTARRVRFQLNSLVQHSVTAAAFQPNPPVGAIPAEAGCRACNLLLSDSSRTSSTPPAQVK
jgi:hypothetical protein